MKDVNNFMFHEDPTRNIEKDLEQVDLRQQYTSLTKDEKIMVFLKIKGFSHRPPTIERLYQDEYYLGGQEFFDHGDIIFPFWKDGLNNIFPNEVTTSKPLLCLSGAIGIGKSTVSKLAMANTLARLSCMINPWKTFKLAPKPLSFIIFHRDEDVANAEFRKWLLDDVLKQSPFFKNLPHRHKIRVLTSGPRGAGGLGTDLIFAIMSEVNFWPNEEKAMERVNSTYIRITSRFDVKDSLTIAGGLIVDSSSKGAGGPTEIFLENAEPQFTWDCRPAHYEVRKNLYERSNGITFSVYTGDGKYPPKILNRNDKEDKYKLEEDQDTDRVIHVPIQLFGEYKSDLIKALQDKSGINTGSSDSFFGGSIEHLSNCSKIKNRIPEVFSVDFYDKEDRIINHIDKSINLLPRGTAIWLGLDLAVVDDTTGIAGCSFDHWENINGTLVPKIKCHFIFGLSRLEGQETSLFHIEQFIEDLNKQFNVIVSADQAFSRGILQGCEQKNIRSQRISTDNTPCEPALYLKYLINNELIDIPENKRLQREALDLRYVGPKRKVDHPKKASISPMFDNPDGSKPGSKDLWDALASSCYSIKLSIIEGEELGYSSGIQKQLQGLSKITSDAREEAAKNFQGMLEGIF